MDEPVSHSDATPQRPLRKRLPREAFGNATGWLVALVLTAGLLALMLAIHNSAAMTAATAFGEDPTLWGPIHLPIDPKVGYAEADKLTTGDAGGVYLDVADRFNQTLRARRPYDDFLRPEITDPERSGRLSLIDALADVRHLTEADIFGGRSERLINYERDQADLEALRVLGEATLKQAGLLAASDRPADQLRAQTYYETAFSLGRHLFSERLIHREMEIGYRLISQSLGGQAALARKLGDEERAERVSDARTRFMTYVNATIQPVWEKLGAINDLRTTRDAADVHVGDVLAIAFSDRADKLWRTEAILRLGRYRHDATRPGDRRGAERFLRLLMEEVANNPDLELAVEQALALTPEQAMVAR